MFVYIVIYVIIIFNVCMEVLYIFKDNNTFLKKTIEYILKIMSKRACM